MIKIGKARYTVGEALFQPSILGLEAYGIVEQLVRIISTVSSENHRQLLENTVLCGGTSSMTGELFANEILVKVIFIFLLYIFVDGILIYGSLTFSC